MVAFPLPLVTKKNAPACKCFSREQQQSADEPQRHPRQSALLLFMLFFLVGLDVPVSQVTEPAGEDHGKQ